MSTTSSKLLKFVATGDGKGKERQQVQMRVRQICGFVHKWILKRTGRRVHSTTPTPMTVEGEKTKYCRT